MTPRAMFIRSLGQVSAAGTGIPALAACLGDPAWQPAVGLDRPDAPPLPVVACTGFTAQGHLPPMVARRLDRPARMLAVAAREALGTLPPGARPAPERTGVSAATGNAGTEALYQVLHAVFLAGPEEAPPMQFPSTVANAPASQLGILEKLAGPNVTFAEKQAGGLRALVEAGRMLAHGRADAVVATAVDEAQWVNAEAYDRLRALRRPGRPGFLLGEGAAALVLSGDPGPAPSVRVAGWASAACPASAHVYSAGHATLARVIDAALADAGVASGELDFVVSMANGSPALARLEANALAAVLGAHRPATFAVADRLGEGSFAALLRVLVAALALTGAVRPVWPPPPHLGAIGFPHLEATPRAALVAGVAGGGSTIAVVLTSHFPCGAGIA